MRKIWTLLTAFTMMFSVANAGDKITIKSITNGDFAAEMMQGMNPIAGTDQFTRISSDGKQVLQCSFKTGQTTAILFDISKTIGEKIDGFDGYIMSPDGKRMLIQTKTEHIYRRSFKATYYIYTIASTKLEKLSDGDKQQVPTWSPDGNLVAFVRNNNIFLVKLLYDNAESAVTTDGKPNEIINGIPDWVNEEEFSHNKALVFSADASMLVWVKYDEKAVKEYSIQMFKGSHPTFNSYSDYPGLDSYKYPKAGFDNAIVSLWSFDIKAKRTQKMQLPLSADSYIPRLKATNDANQVIAFTMNRHQDELCLYSVNPRSTVAQLLIKETSPKYIKEEAIGNILITPNNILIPNDKEGAMNLYLYSRNGQLIRKIGNNNTVITDVYGINDATGEVYYQAALPTPHDRKVFVSKKNGSVEELTKQEGWNQARFSGDFKYFLNTWSNYNTPFVFTIRDNQGKVLSTPINNEKLKNKIANYDWAKREAFTFTTSEGIQLDGWMMKPLNFNPAKRYPVVLFQYSGPGSQQVINSWNAGSMGQGGAFDAYLAQNDIIVVCVDGRGTGGREAAFEKATYLQLGRLEAKDQVETALWLGKQSYVDKDKIGIWGWSFGGFNTLMSMSEGRKVFKAGVAVAAPTDWKFYDTIYTERYMRTPKENPDGYKDNPISRVNQLEGALLLCHGTADDNVHVQNAYEYSEALVQADKDFKELYYTNRNHSIYGGNTRNHLLRQISNFFINELK